MEPGRQVLDLSLLVNGQAVERIRPTVVLQQRVVVAKARRALRRGETISDADLVWEEELMTRPAPGLVATREDILGKAAARGIRAGQPIQLGWLDMPVAVERGQSTLVVLETGGLRIRTIGVALDSGRVGDLITVRNPDSQLRYQARVEAPGQARVETMR
ncbi:MAG: flagellar basal body P-ring formation chaperone FlgA [Magnetococcus sp. WYHC-3]